MVIPMDNFDVILGNEFLILAKVSVMPYLGGLMIADEGCPSREESICRRQSWWDEGWFDLDLVVEGWTEAWGDDLSCCHGRDQA